MGFWSDVAKVAINPFYGAQVVATEKANRSVANANEDDRQRFTRDWKREFEAGRDYGRGQFEQGFGTTLADSGQELGRMMSNLKDIETGKDAGAEALRRAPAQAISAQEYRARSQGRQLSDGESLEAMLKGGLQAKIAEQSRRDQALNAGINLRTMLAREGRKSEIAWGSAYASAVPAPVTEPGGLAALMSGKHSPLKNIPLVGGMLS